MLLQSCHSDLVNLLVWRLQGFLDFLQRQVFLLFLQGQVLGFLHSLIPKDAKETTLLDFLHLQQAPPSRYVTDEALIYNLFKCDQ